MTLRSFSSFHKMHVHLKLRCTSILSKLEKSLKSRERKVVFHGNIVQCSNRIMWKHNQLCNIVQSFQFMHLETKKINPWLIKKLLNLLYNNESISYLNYTELILVYNLIFNYFCLLMKSKYNTNAILIVYFMKKKNLIILLLI